ncbi:coiled-coil domain-containing protein 115 [Atheta coriaria]|uniref:coiled-coil domain-containing protein 115 n=1 Tax=Dalotia coriaria TaxID=877792 RepID=UPI0031F3E860
MGVHDLSRINTLLDRLTLESLSLMEQHIAVKIELEKCMVGGESHVTKARYIMGHQQVSQLQLPNEDCNEFQAMGVVHHDSDNKDIIKDNLFDLEFKTVGKRSEADDVALVVNPVQWFGVLVPQSLHLAQEKFKQTLHWSIKSVNVQQKLSDCLMTIAKLNKLIN